MRPDLEPDFPETWEDPEFAPVARSGRPLQGKTSPQPPGRHASDVSGGRTSRGRLWVPTLVLAALFVGFALDPLIGPAIQGLLTGIGLTLAVLIGAMALGMAGSGLFSIGDRVIDWAKRSRQRPEDEIGFGEDLGSR